jgi:hypothetical protein
MVLPKLWVHRTGIFTHLDRGWFRLRQLYGSGGGVAAREEFLRISFEFVATADATKVVGDALVLERSGALRWIDLHPTHRVDNVDAHSAFFCTYLMMLPSCRSTEMRQWWISSGSG